MERELKTNALQGTAGEQYQIRKSIVRLLGQGKKGRDIAELLDVSESHVSHVKKLYAERGISGIKPQRRGRNTGEKRKLTPEQEREIQRIIVDKTPDQLMFKECMWSRATIGGLIKHKYKIDLPLSTLGGIEEDEGQHAIGHFKPGKAALRALHGQHECRQDD